MTIFPKQIKREFGKGKLEKYCRFQAALRFRTITRTQALENLRRTFKWNAEPERRPFSFGAINANGSAHQLNQIFTDREPQTNTAVRPRRRGVDLRKGLEEPMKPLFGNSDAAVAHLKTNDDATFSDLSIGNVNPHAAGLCKLQSVIDQIEQYLSESSTITVDQTWNV